MSLRCSRHRQCDCATSAKEWGMKRHPSNTRREITRGPAASRRSGSRRTASAVAARRDFGAVQAHASLDSRAGGRCELRWLRQLHDESVDRGLVDLHVRVLADRFELGVARNLHIPLLELIHDRLARLLERYLLGGPPAVE